MTNYKPIPFEKIKITSLNTERMRARMNLVSELFNKCAYELSYDTVGNDVNYKFVEGTGGVLYIYFQGSNSATDWVENFRFWPKVKYFFRNLFHHRRKYVFGFGNAKLYYHRGFLDCFEQVKPIIIKKIQTKAVTPNLTRNSKFKWKYKYKRIIIVGYSHGAALAGICYETCRRYRPDLVPFETLEGHCFEAPRWLWNSRKHDELWRGCIVYRNHTDIVTHCPPALFGFRFPCEVIHIGKKVKYGPFKSHFPGNVYNSLLELDVNYGELVKVPKVTREGDENGL